MSESQPNRTLSLLATCGIIAPISFTVVVIILAFMWPGYNHVTDTLSKLGRVGAPNAIIMNIAGFALRGILILAFAFGLHRGISERRGSRIGLVLMTVYGAADVLAALFPSDPSNLASFTNRMHDLFSFIAWGAMIFAPIAISQIIKKDGRWEGYQLYSLATGLVLLVLVAIFDFFGYGIGFRGALQRIIVGVWLFWIEVMAIKLLRLSIRLGA